MPAPFEPVSAEDLARLRELNIARDNLASRNLELGLEQASLWAAARRVQNEEEAMFRRIATERGLPEAAIMNINPRTGEVVVLPDESSAPAEPPPPST